MSKVSIPSDIQAQVHKLIDEFNQEHFNDEDFKEFGIVGYSARFKGKYLQFWLRWAKCLPGFGNL